MAAVEPDFRAGFVDPAPASNADVGRTIGVLLGLEPHDKGKLVGRVLSETLNGGELPKVERRVRPPHPGPTVWPQSSMNRALVMSAISTPRASSDGPWG